MTDPNDEINRIAATVLGKTADGLTMQRYATPADVDASLLVGIPRYLNRQQYQLQEQSLPFVGFDTWNAYEFSCLLDNGYPLNGQLRWTYASDSPNIVESKSAKLYLNSFNMSKQGQTPTKAINSALRQISEDLSKTVGTGVDVHFFAPQSVASAPPFNGAWQVLEQHLNITELAFEHHCEDPGLLQVLDHGLQTLRWTSSALRSNCRVTNQPDWGDVFILIRGRQSVTPASLLQYLVSMRQENHFHEEICECIFQRLQVLLEPDELMVGCLYTRRGGIDINPVRATSAALLQSQPICHAATLSTKTLRQ